MPLFARNLLLFKRFVSTVTRAMERHMVIPDLFDEGVEDTAQVIYKGGVCVEPGIILTPTEVKDKPIVRWNFEKDGWYAVLMTDLDAPCREDPVDAEWQHWLVGNIPGKHVEKGQLLAQYIGAAPPEGTGLHRYVIMVFQQRGKLSFKGPTLYNDNANGRAGFSTKALMETYRFGDPIALNFFQAQFDCHVQTIYKKLNARKPCRMNEDLD